MTSVITSIVDQTLGRSRIPESAKPVTLPSLMEPERPAGKKRKPATKSAKPNNEAVILGALDYREGRTADEVAQRAGVSRWLVYKYLRRFLDLRLVVVGEPRAARCQQLFRAFRGLQTG